MPCLTSPMASASPQRPPPTIAIGRVEWFWKVVDEWELVVGLPMTESDRRWPWPLL